MTDSTPSRCRTPTTDTQPYWDGLNAGSTAAAALRRLRQAAALSAAGLRCVLVDERRRGSDASGNGRVHSWTVTHHAFHPGFKPDLPYTLVTVDLDEGVRMNAQLRGLDPTELRIGLPVRIDYEPVTADITLPVVVPAR